MADAPSNEPIPSSSEKTVVPEKDDCPLPEKRRKLTENAPIEKLELRLGGILCCAVCLDLPQAAVYQCTNGHLMCVACFTHLLADARLRDESATCPNCRVEISKSSASRNLAVEKTVSELPSECKFCSSVFPRHSVQYHEEKICEERQFTFSQIVVGPPAKRGHPTDGLVRIVSSVYRLVAEGLRRAYLVAEVQVSEPAPALPPRRYRRLTGCKYGVLGCGWRGPAHEGAAHEAACGAPSRSAGDALRALADRELRATQETALYKHIVDLLSYEKITFNDLQLKPYRTEEFVHKLYYESSRFSAFGQQWVVKAFVNKHQRDPTQSADRELTYQVILKSKVSGPMTVQWVVVGGPHGAGAAGTLATAAHSHAFSDDAPEAAPRALTAHHHHANRLLATKAIHLRLIMFLSSK